MEADYELCELDDDEFDDDELVSDRVVREYELEREQEQLEQDRKQLLAYWETMDITYIGILLSNKYSYRPKPSDIEKLCNTLKSLGIIRLGISEDEYIERQRLYRQPISSQELQNIRNEQENHLPIRFEDNTFLIDLDTSVSMCFDIDGTFIELQKR